MHMAGAYHTAVAKARAREQSEPHVMFIPAGGSSPLGNIGFVEAAREVGDNVDDIYIALGTMGSAIGLDIGLRAAGSRTRVIAVRASNRPTSSDKKIAAMYRDTVAFIRKRDPSFPEVTLDPELFVVDDRQLGQGYAMPTAAGRAATKLAEKHGIKLDDTYTAKAFASLVARADRDKRVLFWLTHSAHPLPDIDIDLAELPDALRAYAK